MEFRPDLFGSVQGSDSEMCVHLHGNVLAVRHFNILFNRKPVRYCCQSCNQTNTGYSCPVRFVRKRARSPFSNSV